MSDPGTVHIVKQGETTTQLAYENGLFWETVWNHAENEQLRNLRGKPNILLAGDKIFIPQRRRREETISTNSPQTFVRKGIPEMLNLRFVDHEGNPFADEPYKLTIDGREVEGTFNNGRLDSDGWIRISVPPNAVKGTIDIGEDGSVLSADINFGHLDPIDTISGVQARLKNLGFYRGPLDGEESPLLEKAVEEFRKAEGLPEGTEINDEVRQRLETLYYC